MCEKIEKLYETSLKNYGLLLKGGYHPELDKSDLLVGDEISWYQMLVRSANWTVTLGRFDVHYATSILGRYNFAPQEGHLKTMLRVFRYLKHHMKQQILCDIEEPDFSDVKVVEQNWLELYPDAREELPSDMPVPKGREVKISTYFDANHAHNLETRRSVTGVVLFINKTLIQWYSKCQATVESST